jgi:hypothetical protein
MSTTASHHHARVPRGAASAAARGRNGSVPVPATTAIPGRHRRAKLISLALFVSLVGGTIGIEAGASHMSSEVAHAGPAVPAHGAGSDDASALRDESDTTGP